jgi:putative heme-binding domain-containing protein
LITDPTEARKRLLIRATVFMAHLSCPSAWETIHIMHWNIGIALSLALAVSVLAATPEEQSAINTRIEALTRLQNIHLDEKPNVKAAVLKVLEQTRGTPNFVKLVQHFKLTNQNAGLIEVAAADPASEIGVAAMRLVLASGDLSSVKSALSITNTVTQVALVQVLGNAKEKKVNPLLETLLNDEKQNPEVRRAAVRALAQTQPGAATLLSAAKQDKLPENVKFIAASELNSAHWPEIKAEAAKVLPLPAGQNAQPLPPMSELKKMKGDATQGAAIFRRENVSCIKCHQIKTEGRDVGPALTEIGNKLTKEAMLEAILDPSAGISFGFEAWQVQLKSGDDAYGLKVNETPEEVAIKDINGIVTRYKKSEIAAMQQSKTSIMPTGLQMTMSTQELVDLLEYLSSLRKAGE